MYKTVRELGRGGFGRVYEVEMSGSRMAMKTLEPSAVTVDAVGMAQLKARFEREVRYQSAVNHPNVVRILAANVQADPPAFFMPLARCTLQDELNADRTLGGAPLRVLFDILAGLDAIHQAGYVHRDLKPSNVLRFDAQGEPQYAVSDFGLMSSPNGSSTTLTPSDAGGGTPFYAAPELVTNMKRATPAADIYSFGAILHDIFVGSTRTPYSQLQGPGAIGAVIEKCTRRSPRLRYRNVVELREELFSALEGYTPHFSSNEEGDVVAMLSGSTELTEEQWDRLLLLLEKFEEEKKSIVNVVHALGVAHFQNLSEVSKDMFVAVAFDFAVFVIRNGFNFDYCDVLAGQLEALFRMGPTETKALALVALLELGASHNRWFVERKFMQLASPELDPQVAQRFLVEAAVQGVNIKGRIAHVELSISTSRTLLSPIIQAAL